MYKNFKHSFAFLCMALLVMVFVLFFFDMILGSIEISIRDIAKIIFTSEKVNDNWEQIVIQYRLPRALSAIIVGISLSISGIQMQTVFRNPLAGPYVLGISAGASLGVAILTFGISFIDYNHFLVSFGKWPIVIFACLGAGLILFLILIVSMRFSNIIMVLILGILFGSAVSAIVNILQYFSRATEIKAYIIWSMGNLGNVDMGQLSILAICCLIGIIMAFANMKVLDALLTGEEYARSLGVNIRLSRILIFISTSILAGTVTAFCGPIGFIGIVVPHLARLVMKTALHKYLMITTLLVGAVMMLLSDIISQLPGMNNTLPINSVTSLLGIPVIIWILLKNVKFPLN